MTDTQYTYTRTYDTGRKLTFSLSGEASIDDIIDTFRGMLVSMGYAPETAGRLVLLDADDGGQLEDV